MPKYSIKELEEAKFAINSTIGKCEKSKKLNIFMKILNLLALCLIIASCQVRHDYKITGTISGIPDSTVIALIAKYDNASFQVASDTIMNGKFNFSDSIGSEVLNMNLVMKDNQKYSGICNLWVGNTDIKVSGTGKYLATWKVKSNIKEQKDENRLLDFIVNYQVLTDSLRLVQIQNRKNNIDDKGLIRSKVDSIRKIQSNVELNFLKKNYNSTIFIMHLCRLAQSADSLQKAEIKGFYLNIDTTYLNTLWGEGIKNALNKVVPPDIGDKYINFKAFDIENKSHQLSEYIGKYILLDFWSTVCYPCLLSLPELRNFSSKYQKDLVVISVSLETTKKLWVNATKRDSITWTNLSDGKGTLGGAGYFYGIRGLPTYILINPEGVIVDSWMGFWPGVFDEKLLKYLQDKSNPT